MKATTAIEEKIDQVLALYVSGTSAAVSEFAASIAIVSLTIYLVYMSYAAARGDLSEPMGKLTKDLVKISLILTVALGGGAYQQYVIGFAYGLVSDLTSVLTLGEAKTVGAAIDYANSGCVVLPPRSDCVPYDEVYLSLATGNENWWGVPDPLYTVAFLLVFLSQLIITVLCLIPVILAKVGMSLMLGIGPVFVLLAIFPTTVKYFESWLAALIGFVMTLVLVAAICSVLPMIFREFLITAVRNGPKGDVSVISDAFALLIASIGLGFTALHTSQLGAQLAGGGVAMDGKGMAGKLTEKLISTLTKDKTDPGTSSQSDAASAQTNSVSQKPSLAYQAGRALGRTPYNSGRVVGNILRALDRQKRGSS